MDAVASRLLLALAGLTDLFAAATTSGQSGQGEYAFLDVDDTVVEVHGHAKQGAGFGYNRVRGPNALLATFTTTGTNTAGPVIVAQRLRKGQTASSPAGRWIQDCRILV